MCAKRTRIAAPGLVLEPAGCGCISASHVAYASFRMEPQYLIAGHAAGVAASLAVERGVPAHEIDISALQQKLSSQDQILHLNKGGKGKKP